MFHLPGVHITSGRYWTLKKSSMTDYQAKVSVKVWS